MKIRYYIYFFIAALIIASGCSGSDSTNKSPIESTNENNSSVVMNPLVIASTDYQSITLRAPTFSTAGKPAPAITAYIAEDGDISVSGSAVSGYVDSYVFAAVDTDHTFSSLSPDTVYRIIVVADNGVDYSVRQIAQSTGGIAPVLAPLVISGTSTTSITLQTPTFTTTGNPLPATTTRGYIGLDGSITVTGSTVGGTVIGGNVNAYGGYTFNTGLSANTVYRIIVVAQNSSGYSVRQIVQSTGGTAPVLRPLFVSDVGTGNIVLDQPTFSTAGNPAPTVEAYIGYDGFISIAGPTVNTAVAGPINVAASGTTFGGLFANTAYRIIVVVQNPSGYSVRQVAIITGNGGVTAPVLDPLDVVTIPPTATTITLAQPTYSDGNPAPMVTAYIGLNGVISASGTTVVGSINSADVSASGTTFGGLTTGTTYCIIVVSQNTTGYSVKRVTQSTL